MTVTETIPSLTHQLGVGLDHLALVDSLPVIFVYPGLGGDRLLLLQVFLDRAVKIDHMLVMETVKNLPTYFPITDESCSTQST